MRSGSFQSASQRALDVTLRYFFNLVGRSDSASDLEGVEASDARTAVSLAYEAIEELLHEQRFVNAHWWGWRLQIVDEAGQEVHRISLSRFCQKRSQRQLV